MKKIVFLISICLCLTGCSSLTKEEKEQLKEYINYSNTLIEQKLKNENPREVLQPYRARYRVVCPIVEKITK